MKHIKAIKSILEEYYPWHEARVE
ncbi:MAG: Unknown protein, partial [uncultured Sulfurovum sp.]